MRMSKWCGLFLFLMLCAVVQLSAQETIRLVGSWSGNLSQNEGGYLDDYHFEIYLIEKQDQYTGRTYVSAAGVEGVMSVSGVLRGNILYLEEGKLLYSRKPSDLSWCFKRMQLRIFKKAGEWQMEGPWQGQSAYGNCLPGWIALKRVTPRA